MPELAFPLCVTIIIQRLPFRSSNFHASCKVGAASAAIILNGRKVLHSHQYSTQPPYRGAFQFDEAADIAGFAPPESYPFDPSAFPEYEHTMTHQSGSAIDHHDEFSTWAFRKQA